MIKLSVLLICLVCIFLGSSSADDGAVDLNVPCSESTYPNSPDPTDKCVRVYSSEVPNHGRSYVYLDMVNIPETGDIMQSIAVYPYTWWGHFPDSYVQYTVKLTLYEGWVNDTSSGRTLSWNTWNCIEGLSYCFKYQGEAPGVKTCSPRVRYYTVGIELNAPDGTDYFTAQLDAYVGYDAPVGTAPPCGYCDLNPDSLYQCPPGYTCDGSWCYDNDECQGNSTICLEGQTCVNTPGSYQCNDTKYFITSNQTGFVLTANGTGNAVYMAPKNSSGVNQLWTFVPGKGGLIVSATTGKVLDVKSGVAYSNVEVITWDVKGPPYSTNQLWTRSATTSTIKSKGGNVVLDVKGASPAPYTPVLVYSPKATGNINQRFTFVPAVSA